MPNEPLKTFRSVEPANWGFGSTATLSSQPFVLYHVRGAEASASLSAGVAVGAPTFTNADQANRFQPWTTRDLSTHYPVAIPNAYDRVYVFPMIVIDTVLGTTGDLPAVPVDTVVSTAVPPASYTAPIVMPFGRMAQSRDYTAINPSTLQRLPLDIIRKYNKSVVLSPDPTTKGIWTALPSYASNFGTSNGLATAVGTYVAPVSTPRSTGTGVGIGAGFQLPPDWGTGFDATGAVSNAASGFLATTSSRTFVGTGLEFNTMGCEELVVNLIAAPTNLPASTIQTQAGATGTVGKAAANFFLMGMFLG